MKHDLNSMSAADLVLALHEMNAPITPQAADLVRVGICDLEFILDNPDLPFEVSEVPEQHRNREGIEHVVTAGLDLAQRDPDRLVEWAALAKAIMDADGFVDVDVILMEMLEAGRTPREGHDLLGAWVALAPKDRPDFDGFGFGAHITPETLALLGNSRIHTDQELAAYASLGYDLEAAAALSAQGMSSLAMRFVTVHEIPEGQWTKVAELPSNWLDAKHRDTFEELQALRDAGWQETLRGATAANLTKLAEVGITTWAEFEKWKDTWAAPLTHKRYVPPVDDPGDLVDVFAELVRGGVKRTHIAEFRLCGAHSPKEMARIAEAGFTPAECKDLRERFGVRESRAFEIASVDLLFVARDKAAKVS